VKILLSILLTIIVLIGCESTQSNSVDAGYTKVSNHAVLESIELDGHLFVIGHNNFNGGFSVIHHPGCPCMKNKKDK